MRKQPFSGKGVLAICGTTARFNIQNSEKALPWQQSDISKLFSAEVVIYSISKDVTLGLGYTFC